MIPLLKEKALKLFHGTAEAKKIHILSRFLFFFFFLGGSPAAAALFLFAFLVLRVLLGGNSPEGLLPTSFALGGSPAAAAFFLINFLDLRVVLGGNVNEGGLLSTSLTFPKDSVPFLLALFVCCII